VDGFVGRFFVWFDGLFPPGLRGGLVLFGLCSIVMMWSYFVGRRMMGLNTDKPVAGEDSPNHEAEKQMLKAQILSLERAIESAAQKPSKAVDPTGTGSLYYENLILRFPSTAERQKMLQTGEFRKLVNTRWDLKEEWPFNGVYIVDFYDNQMARVQNATYDSDIEDEWYLWRLKSETELEVRLITSSFVQSSIRGSAWFIDGHDGEAPEDWEVHIISFSHDTKDFWGTTITTLNGFHPEPLTFS
jgi:hypothetical protein